MDETPLNRAHLNPDPILQFSAWYQLAFEKETHDPTAMTLATANAQGIPSARIVLLKAFNQQGFVFYTNFHSSKAKALEENPFAALLFWWPRLARQIRIEGKVSRVADHIADAYFETRPRGSQLGAWSSPQSQPISNRETLTARVKTIEKAAQHSPLPRPDFWGGYIVAPTQMEFWQSRQNRLHDRFLYEKKAKSHWTITRLAP